MSDQAADTKEGNVGGGGDNSRNNLNPLPPPPTLLSPPPHTNVANSNARGGLGLSSLPPPPTLMTPRNGVAGGGINSTTGGASTSSTMPLPPPPKVATSSSSSSLPPPPTLTVPSSSLAKPPTYHLSIDNTSPASNEKKTTTNIISTTQSQSVHTTTEQIPPLSSAPNSGSLFSTTTTGNTNNGGSAQPPQQQQASYIDVHSVYPTAAHSKEPRIYATYNTNNVHIASPPPQFEQPQQSKQFVDQSQQSQQLENSAAYNHFNAPSQQPPQQLQEQQDDDNQPKPPPASGGSWTAWATSAAEKAGQLAYTAAESAADLVVQSRVSSDLLSLDYNKNANSVLGGAGLDMVGKSPGSPYDAQGGDESATTTITTKDNFANLFITSPGGSDNGGNNHGEITSTQDYTTSSNSAHSSSSEHEVEGGRNDSNLVDMMETPNSSVHPYTPTTTKDQQKSIETTTQQQQQQTNKVTTKRRALSNPSSTILSKRQTNLSVLILPTSEAQSIASRNNTTLSDMFRVYGNARPSSNNNLGSTRKQVDSSLEPMLPPFRSANRSMALSWDYIHLDFVSPEDMDVRPISNSVMEEGLGISARLWDEDKLSRGGFESNNNDEEEDVEMDQLEGYVANALAEDDAEEKARKEDGIPSMTSATPTSRRNSSQQSDNQREGSEEEEHQRGREPFPPRPEEALESCADAAFALTSHPTTSPYLLRFRHTLDCATDGMSHEMLNNPSVVILAASTSDNSYVNCLAELANVHHLPKPYHDGRYDPNGLRREFLLLHDVIHGPKDFEENVALSTMRERFGYGCCSVLKINTLVPRPVAISDGYASVGEDVEWENSANPSSPFVQNTLSKEYSTSTLPNGDPPPIRGACLSPADKRAIRRYVANMVATGLVPAVERRIAHLNATVTNAKRGVKNVIKSFWRKPKENILVSVSGYNENGGDSQTIESSHDGGGGGGGGASGSLSSSSGSVKYRYDSIESQTRLLADTLFLMRDYEAALSSYRLVKDDYKHDKAHLHYASAQEMMVLCMYSLDPSGRDLRYSHDVHHSIETALYSYTRASDEEKESDATSGVTRPGKAPYATRLATRLCLAISAARSLCDGKHMEIADLLASASSHETPLGAAILLEQSSAHYYRAGMLRKYAFHMLMAGHMFRSASQERHAFRCFAASLYVYHGERWGELRSHLRSALAAQLYGMGRYALSMQFYAKLIGMMDGGRVSVRSQQKFLNHIVNICKEHQSSALVAIDRMNKSNAQSNVEGSAAAEETMVKGFSDAVRQIEISNIGFPAVQDSSISVRVAGAGNSCVSLGHSDSLLTMEDDNNSSSSGKGDEAVWQDMTICAEAELRSSSAVISPTINSDTNDQSSSHDDNGLEAPPLAHSGDELIDKVITEIDKEERDAEYRERQKRKGVIRTPEVRAMSEPLSVSFSLKNPLGLDIEMKDMQLVASLTCPKSGLIHTNEFSVSSKEQANKSSTNKSWTFHGSSHQFHSPEFMCQRSINSDECSSLVDDELGPYFVVTKSSLKMGPNSDTFASLKICPLVEGDFRILGVRFHLLGEVWIYHQFDTPGPLLQDTRDNKSKRGKLCSAKELYVLFIS